MSDTITYTKNDFTYKIKYNKQNNSVSFHVTHNTEFLEWTKTINDNLIDGTSEQIKVSLSPKNLFKLFNDYSHNCLPERYAIIMPDSLDNVSIEIHSTLEYQDEIDIKTITFEPVDIPFETRSDLKVKLKLEQRDKHFETELDSRDKHTDQKLQDISAQLNQHMFKLQNISTQLEQFQSKTVQNLVTRIDQLNILIKNVSDDSTNNRIMCEKINQQLESISKDIDECIELGTNNSFDALNERFSKRIDKISTNIRNYFPNLTNARKKFNQCYDVVSTNVSKCITNIKRKPIDGFTAVCYIICIAAFIFIGVISISALLSTLSSTLSEFKIQQLELKLKDMSMEIDDLDKTISKIKKVLSRIPNNCYSNRTEYTYYDSNISYGYSDHIGIILSYIIVYIIMMDYIPTHNTFFRIFWGLFWLMDVLFMAYCCWYYGLYVSATIMWNHWVSMIYYPIHCIGTMMSLPWKFW